MTARATTAFLATLCAVLFHQQSLPKTPKGSETVMTQIRVMKTVAVQIRYTSDAPPAATPQGMPPIPNLRGDLAGTGFFVSRQGYVLTAGHVIRMSANSAKENGATKIQFKVGILLDTSSQSNIIIQGSFFLIDAIPIEIDDVHDIAILKLSGNPFNEEVKTGIVSPHGMLPLHVATATLKSELLPEGSDVLISGYPLDIPTLVTQKGMVASESFSIVDVPVQRAPAGIRMPEAIDSILLDAVVNPGNSGGPVYEPNSGKVIGICEAYKDSPIFTTQRHKVEISPNEELIQNSGLAIVIPIKYGIELLRKKGVNDFSTE